MVFIPAKVDDNPHLDREQYIASLGKLDAVERARLLSGDWVVQNEGLVFPGLPACVVDPQLIQTARTFGGCDWGWHNPAALLVGMLDQDDVLWIIEEVYGSKMTMDGSRPGDEAQNHKDLVARGMDLQRRHRIEMWHCDPAEPRNIERFRRADLPARKADNRIMLGVATVNARIKTGRLRIFRGCQNLIREAGLYRWPTPEERRSRGEEPIDHDNHACSALRYMVQGMDRTREVWRGDQPEPVAEPAPPDYANDYTISPPQERYRKIEPQERFRTVEQQWEASEEARRLQRDHLLRHGWETCSGG